MSDRPHVNDLVERTDQEGWGVGKVDSTFQGDARVMFGDDPRYQVMAWVAFKNLVPARGNTGPDDA